MRKLIGLIFFVCLISHAFSQNNLPPVYEIKTDTAYITIPDSCWQMLEDANRKWSIDQVSQSLLSRNFHPVTDSHYHSSTYWIRYRLKNDLPHEVKIFFNGFANFFDLYTKQGDVLWRHQKTGSFLPWSERDGIKNNYHLLLALSPGQELSVYQRLKFDFRNLPERLSAGFGFTEQLLRDHYILDEEGYFDKISLGILIGVCMLAALFSFLFFMTAREWVYFHASMWYFSLALLKLVDGPGIIFFRENLELIATYTGDAVLAFFYFFLISTVRLALATRRRYPRWDKFLVFLIVLSFASAVAVYAHLFEWNSAVIILMLFSVGITCVPGLQKNNRIAQLLAVSVLSFVIFNGGLIACEMLNVSLPAWVWHHTGDLNVLCLFFIIATSSWMLFERYKQMQKKLLQEAFEKEQFAKEREIERRQLIERQKTELEKTVEERTAELKHSLTELKSAQAQLVQSEKMASLGELTAGIAHEIQNPLNFVNNFSEVNRELIEELQGERSKVKGERNEQLEDGIINDLKDNEEKIIHHGKRADAIVKGMLQHSRTSSGQKELTDINALCDEYLRLAYQGFRARDKSFNATLTKDFDGGLRNIDVVPQEIGRVILNLINNAFYAVNEKGKQGVPGYEPTVIVGTRRLQDRIEISVEDNGNGIPTSIKEKIFQPFFTTKPTGQGTGLGLSLAYDIIKAHGGEIKVETKEAGGSEFIVQLPVA